VNKNAPEGKAAKAAARRQIQWQNFLEEIIIMKMSIAPESGR
jgi:hypothetical protein